ncbi:inner nuclear membrane protein enriched at telomere/subtelomere region [Coemansia sp. RSA 1285]|nr:inner nuclear membrane protein enriched at telomere/subtelomere region [Coemansia sp. RSA 1285]
MSDNPNPEYLEEGFDPHTLKVSSLRNILVKHDVEYPSNAKKGELVELLEKKVLSKANKLRKEAKKQRRAVADGRDIEIVVDSSKGAANAKEGEGEEEEGASSVSGRTRAKKTKKGKPTKAAPAAAKKEKEKEDAAPAATTKATKRKHSETEEEQKQPEKKTAAKSSEKPKPPHKADEPKQAKTGAKRRIRQEIAAKESSAESSDEEQQQQQTPRKTVATTSPSVTPKNKKPKTAASGSFSDDNPFQSSPDTPRKRRRKTPANNETPMSALRKSQVSDLTFKVSLPRATASSANEDDASGVASSVAAESEASASAMYTPPPPRVGGRQRSAMADFDADDVFSTPLQSPPFQQLMPQQQRSRVGDLVARYQGQPADADAEPSSPRSPTVRIRDGLHRPADEGRRGRFTMTPDALRQMAAQNEEKQQQQQQRRRTMAEAGGLPPVAPRIPVPSIEEMEADAQTLQRRRVATLRQHGDAEATQQQQQLQPKGAHSRRSSIASIASSVSEARGIPGIPAASNEAIARQRRAPKRRAAWAARLLAWGAIGVSAFVWRTHEQFAVGFGNTRAELAPLAPPAHSALVPPAPIDAEAATPIERLAHLAKYVRAAYVEPAALACPEHAECVPYTAIPAALATQQAAWSAADGARDRWVVPVAAADAAPGLPRQHRVGVVQCDAGFVLRFPPLASRVFPRVPECVRDASAALRVKQLEAAMERECRMRRGRAQCDQTLLQQARQLASASADDSRSAPLDSHDEADEIERLGVALPELRAAMWSRRAPRLSAAEFDALFGKAAAALAEGDAVSHYVLEFEDDEGGASGASDEVQYFVARTPLYTPMCYVRRAVLSLVVGNISALAAALALCVAGFVAARRLAARSAEARAADALVVRALETLRRHARRHYADPALSPAPAVSSLQLRDMLLLPPAGDGERRAGAAPSAFFDPRARARVWSRVREVVERNANVRCRTTAVRGEPMRVWEWIGPLVDADVAFDADDGLDAPFASPVVSPLASPQRPEETKPGSSA